jgi:sugar-specific transcriptional regulator TrmB
MLTEALDFKGRNPMQLWRKRYEIQILETIKRLRKSWKEIKQERMRRKDIGNFMATGQFKLEMMLEER